MYDLSFIIIIITIIMITCMSLFVRYTDSMNTTYTHSTQLKVEEKATKENEKEQTW